MNNSTQAGQTLRDSDLGVNLGAQDIDSLIAIATLQEFQSGEKILQQFACAGDVYLPCSGMIVLERNAFSGHRQVIGFLKRGDYLGFTPTDSYPYSAVTLVPSTLLKFDRRKFTRLCADIPALQANVSRITNTVLGGLLDHLFAIGKKRAHERVAFLLYQLHQRGADTAKPKAIPLPMKRIDIGDYLGLTLETTSRAFSRLRDEDVIATPDHHSVVILNYTALEELAKVD